MSKMFHNKVLINDILLYGLNFNYLRYFYISLHYSKSLDFNLKNILESLKYTSQIIVFIYELKYIIKNTLYKINQHFYFILNNFNFIYLLSYLKLITYLYDFKYTKNIFFFSHLLGFKINSILYILNSSYNINLNKIRYNCVYFGNFILSDFIRYKLSI